MSKTQIALAGSLIVVMGVTNYWVKVVDEEFDMTSLRSKFTIDNRVGASEVELPNGVKIPSLDQWGTYNGAGGLRSRDDRLLSSSVTCERRGVLQHEVCHCTNCCVYNTIVHVFDQAPEVKPFDTNITVQMFERMRELGIRHFPRSGKVSMNFTDTETMWVETPTHYTNNHYLHILSQWFWNADIYNTWRLEGWLDYGHFNWMLEYNLGQRESSINNFYAFTHPENYAPLKLFRAANYENRMTKVCYSKMLIGHVQSTQGMWEGVLIGLKSLGQNTAPTMIINKETEVFVREFLEYYTKKTYLKEVNPIPRRVVVISRRETSKRRIINEDKLIELMTAKGFDVDVVNYEHLDQESADIRTRQASLVFGVHGAGFANAIVCRQDTIIYEVHPWGFQKWVYAHLAKAMGNTYMYWNAPDESYTVHTQESLHATEKMDTYRHRDVIVDEDDFLSSLDQIQATLDERGLW